jgi:uncharacterized protein (DUF2062 family)
MRLAATIPPNSPDKTLTVMSTPVDGLTMSLLPFMYVVFVARVSSGTPFEMNVIDSAIRCIMSNALTPGLPM